jgi:type III secretion protein L
MLANRSLVLSSSAVLAETILRREDLAGVQLAGQVLNNARHQAEQIVQAAREQAQREKDQALAQFWEGANQFLHDVQQQRRTLEQESMVAVEELLANTLTHLLDETSLAERTRALVRHLAGSQSHEANATLSAHPDQLDELRLWLSDSRFAEHWQLKSDPSLGADSLRLSDANGAFDIDWVSLRRGLLGTPAA